MEAAMPLNPSGGDPFAALTAKFAALDAMQEAGYAQAKQTLARGRRAVQNLKRSAEQTTSGDTPSRTRLCIQAFTKSDENHADAIDEAAEKAERDQDLPVTKALDRAEVRARLERVAEERTGAG